MPAEGGWKWGVDCGDTDQAFGGSGAVGSALRKSDERRRVALPYYPRDCLGQGEKMLM